MVRGDLAVTGQQASDPAHAPDHQMRRVFCYLEVCANKYDDWSDEFIRSELDRINGWERMRVWDYAYLGLQLKPDYWEQTIEEFQEELEEDSKLSEAIGRLGLGMGLEKDDANDRIDGGIPKAPQRRYSPMEEESNMIEAFGLFQLDQEEEKGVGST